MDGHEVVRTTVQTAGLKSRLQCHVEASRNLQERVLITQTQAFPAVMEKLGDDDFLATFPDLPEALTGGASLAEARENAGNALE